VITEKLRHVYEDVDRHGNVRLYFWRGEGHRKIRLREVPGTPQFLRAYTAAHDADTLKAAAGSGFDQTIRLPKPGTWGWLCNEYLGSGEFKQLGHHTRRRRRQLLEHTWDEPIAPNAKEKFIDFPLPRMAAKAIRVLRDRKADAPESANGLIKAIRQVFTWALAAEIPGVTGNPARDVPYFKSSGDGFHTWTVEEVRQYEARHPLGTKARLALDLLLYTGVRRSDVVRLGPQMVKEGWLHFTEEKDGKRNPKQRAIPILPELAASIAAMPSSNLAFLVTAYGRTFTANGFGNWFRDRCDEVGLNHCTAHGLRKAGATIAAENGATTHQLMAIFGWTTVKQAEHYTKKASRKRLAGDAMHLLKAPRTGTEA
jgi:integrase